MNEQLNQEENNTLKHEDILEVFEKLIKYLRLAQRNLRKNHKKILEELEKWHSEITIQEIENGLNLILNSSNKWFNLYKNTNDILQIPLKEYDLISKESAYILGDCALIKELYIRPVRKLSICYFKIIDTTNKRHI